MDIGYKSSRTFLAIVIMLIYWNYLAIAFLLPSSVGNALTSIFINYGVVGSLNYKPGNLEEIDASMGYLYYYMMRNLYYSFAFFIILYFATSKMIFFSVLIVYLIYKYITLKSSNPLVGYKPSFPLAFIYGTEKAFMFHSDSMIRELKSKEKCEVLGVNTGHWVMVGNDKIINEMIKRRLKEM